MIYESMDEPRRHATMRNKSDIARQALHDSLYKRHLNCPVPRIEDWSDGCHKEGKMKNY